MAEASCVYKNKIILTAVGLGYFMVMLDVTIINVSLYSIEVDLLGQIQDLQWIVSGYALTFSCFLIFGGNLGDLYGHRKIFISGSLIFVVTSFLCGLAVNLFSLISFRFLQGIGAALMVPTSLAIINGLFSGNKRNRNNAVAIWAGVGGIAAAFGPVLGAILTASFNWRLVFFINIPIGILSSFLTYHYVPLVRKNNSHLYFDTWGQILIILSIGLLAFDLIEVGRLGWQSKQIVIGFIAFVLLFTMFIVLETKKKHPMIPTKLFKDKDFYIPIAIGIIMNVACYGTLFILPLYFQKIKNYPVLTTGLAVLPVTGFASIASYIGGKLTSKIGARKTIFLGLLVTVGGFVGVLQLEISTPYVFLFTPLAAIGFGTSLIVPAVTIAVLNAVPSTRAGVATATFNVSRQIGSMIGIAAFGTIISLSRDFIFGMQYIIVIALTILICALFAALKLK